MRRSRKIRKRCTRSLPQVSSKFEALVLHPFKLFFSSHPKMSSMAPQKILFFQSSHHKSRDLSQFCLSKFITS